MTAIKSNTENTGTLRAPTIGEIAEYAGVSKSTVSLALRNSRKIQKSTCYKIQSIAREMNYRPNPLVSAQMSHIRQHNNRKAVPTIGFLNIWDSNVQASKVNRQYLNEYCKGAKERAEKLGFGFELLEFDRAKYSDRRIQEVLTSRSIEGLILAPFKFSTDDLRLDWSEFTISAIGCFENFHNIHRFFYDNFVCMQRVLSILQKLSYRRIGFITNHETEEQTGHHLSGGFLEYQARLIPKEAQIPLLNLPNSESFYTEEDFENLENWLLFQKPEVIISPELTTLNHLESIGYNFPDDLGYVVLGCHEESMEGCAAYCQSKEKVGAVAVDSLSSRLYENERGLPERPITTLLHGKFVEGKTLRKAYRKLVNF